MTGLRVRVGLMLIAVVLLSGCPKKRPADEEESTGLGLTKDPPQAGVMDLRRTMFKTQALNNLRNIAQFYSQEAITNNRPPEKAALMATLRQQLPKAYEGVEEGFYIVRWGAKAESGVVIAHEKEPDSNGIMFVAFGDNSVQKLTKPQLDQALLKQ